MAHETRKPRKHAGRTVLSQLSGIGNDVSQDTRNAGDTQVRSSKINGCSCPGQHLVQGKFLVVWWARLSKEAQIVFYFLDLQVAVEA